jgi:hypothetical protein
MGLTDEQLRAMFSKEERKRGISSKDIEIKKARLEEARDKMLPTRFKVIKSGEKKGQVVRIKKFGEIPRPTEQASEAQREAVRRFTEEAIPSATHLSIIQLIGSGKINTMTFKQLTDKQKQQLEVLRATNRSKYDQVLRRLRANEAPRPITDLTRKEAHEVLRKRDVQRKDQIIVALQGQRPDDPAVQQEILQLTDGQRNAAVEELFSFASRKGKTSPHELTPGQVRYILSQVKKQYTREGVRKLD